MKQIQLSEELAIKFRQVLDESFNALQTHYTHHLQKELHDKHWKFDSAKNDIQKYYPVQTPNDSSYVSKSFFDISTLSENMIHYLLDVGEILKFDGHLEGAEILGELSLPKSKQTKMVDEDIEVEKAFLFAYNYKGHWPVAPRDFVCIKAVRKLKNGLYFLARTSVEYPDFVTKSGRVRGEYGVGSGNIIIPKGTSHCTYISIMTMNMKGWLPGFFISLASSMENASMVLMRENGSKYLKSKCVTQLH